jgi:outer membrane protein
MFSLCLAVVMLLAAGATAQAMKIGVIDVKEVMQKSDPGQEAQSDLKGEFDKLKKDLEERQAEIQEMKADMEKQALALSDEAKQMKQMEFQRKVRELQDMNMAYKRRMQMREKKALDPVLDMLAEVVEKYGKNNDYDILLDRNNSGVVYFDENAVEVTSEIIVEMNKAWKNK